jgi:hypothetical protein
MPHDPCRRSDFAGARLPGAKHDYLLVNRFWDMDFGEEVT